MKKIHSLSRMLLLAVLSFTFTVCAKSQALPTYDRKIDFGPQLVEHEITFINLSDGTYYQEDQRKMFYTEKIDTIWFKNGRKAKRPKIDKHFRMGNVRTYLKAKDIIGRTFLIQDVLCEEEELYTGKKYIYTLTLEDSAKKVTYMKIEKKEHKYLSFLIRDADMLNQLKGRTFVEKKSGKTFTVKDCYYDYRPKYTWDDVYITPRSMQVEFEDKSTILVKDASNYLTEEEYAKLKKEEALKELERKATSGEYKMVLNKVVKPKSSKFTVGESACDDYTKTVIYKDNVISLILAPGEKSFSFELKNISNSTLTINWDDIIYINEKSESQRVVHSGIKYRDVENPQQPSLVAKNSSIKDALVPAKHIHWSSWSKEWDVYSLLNWRGTHGHYDGKQVRLIFPIQVNGVSYEYTFLFDLIWEWEYPKIREKWLRLQEENKQNVN